jgi:hypothetical protein
MSLPSNIPGVYMTGTGRPEPSHVLVIAPEKSGKSTLATTLIDYPEKGDMPLVIGFDPTGPESCAAIGKPVPAIKVKDAHIHYPEVSTTASTFEKARAVVTGLERAFRGDDKPFKVILVDCASTMMSTFFSEDARKHVTKEPRQTYQRAAQQSQEIMDRLLALGVDIVWLAWLREAIVEESGSGQDKRKKMVLGGALIEGQKFRALLQGRAHNILILEKYKGAQNDALEGVQTKCGDGFNRRFHTRQWNNIEAGGRFNLPNPAPADLGWILRFLKSKPKQGAAKALGQQPKTTTPAAPKAAPAVKATPAPKGA